MDLVARVKGLLLDPKAEWQVIEREPTDTAALLKRLRRGPCRHSGGVRLHRHLDRRHRRLSHAGSSRLFSAVGGYVLTFVGVSSWRS